MRKIILSMSVSLDGYFEGPDGDLGWHLVDDELHTYFNEKLATMGAFLMGRADYELMTGFWPAAYADPSVTGPMKEFAGIWRTMPKIVFSRTLERADEDGVVIEREVDPAAIRALKERPGGDMTVGGARLAAAFRRHDLIDEYQLYVHPVLLGRGRQLFEDAPGNGEDGYAYGTGLRLLGTRTFGNGVVLLHHGRADG